MGSRKGFHQRRKRQQALCQRRNMAIGFLLFIAPEGLTIRKPKRGDGRWRAWIDRGGERRFEWQGDDLALVLREVCLGFFADLGWRSFQRLIIRKWPPKQWLRTQDKEG